MRAAWFFPVALVLVSVPAIAQESRTGAELRTEGEKVMETCGRFKTIISCTEEFFTGHPLHIAIGSIAPQDGVGFGLAYVTRYDPSEDWRLSWNLDAIGSTNASWRAGVYLKIIHTPLRTIRVVPVEKGRPRKNFVAIPSYTVFNVYAQTISLEKLFFFGLGPSTLQTGKSIFGMRETIAGASAVKPFYDRLNMGVYGEVNGRFVSVRPSLGQPSPSIEQLYTESTAPGLTSQPGTLEFGEGIRMQPVFFRDSIRLNYDMAYQQFVTASNPNFSFQRLTVDLSHEFALHRATSRTFLARDANGPDECSVSLDKRHPECPRITLAPEGTIGLRFFLAVSMTPGGGIVPFYFQPTLGGMDVNGSPSLSSYQDYRFRAPNALLFRQSFDHSIWGPFGLSFMADEGTVGLRRADLGSTNWLHSFSAGLTLRAGGFPRVFLLFSWGGSEGTHTIAHVETSLLGGSPRPSLY